MSIWLLIALYYMLELVVVFFEVRRDEFENVPFSNPN